MAERAHVTSPRGPAAPGLPARVAAAGYVLRVPDDVPVLPTAELHVHIEGTLEPELAFWLAARNGRRCGTPDLDALRRAYAFGDLQSFLDLYYELTRCCSSRADFADLADAYFARAAAQGVRHAEMFVDPQAHTGRGVPLEVGHGGAGRGVRTARRAARHLRPAHRLLPARPGPAEAEALVPPAAPVPRTW